MRALRKATGSTSLSAFVWSMWRHRALVAQMSKREVVGRYKGSVLGLAWSFFYPAVMLAVYTFVFSVVFKARWGLDVGQSRWDFALNLFMGMTVFALFAESAAKAPTLIVGNVSYVKKVVFPLELLGVIALGGALFHSLVSFAILTLAALVINGALPITAVALPVVLVPLILVSLAFILFTSALGVFLRDVSQSIGVLLTVLQFLSPVFYPVAALPERFQQWMLLNPLTFVIEQARIVFFEARWPDWLGLGIYWVVSVLILQAAFWWFQKTRKGFADVL